MHVFVLNEYSSSSSGGVGRMNDSALLLTRGGTNIAAAVGSSIYEPRARPNRFDSINRFGIYPRDAVTDAP